MPLNINMKVKKLSFETRSKGHDTLLYMSWVSENTEKRIPGRFGCIEMILKNIDFQRDFSVFGAYVYFFQW